MRLGCIARVLAMGTGVGGTGLETALHEAAEGIPQRALVVVVSDLFVVPDALHECLQHLRYRKHDVALLHLLDDSEIAFDFERPTRFLDLEGGEPIFADPTMMARQYRVAIQDYLTQLKEVVGRAGVDYHRVNNQDAVDEVLAKLLTRRRQLAGGKQK